MNKLEYAIIKPNIQTVKIVGPTIQSWYDYNDNIVPWVGTDENGNELEEGVYFYIAKTTTNANQEIEKQGLIHLVRKE
jgi:hypothetical protein